MQEPKFKHYFNFVDLPLIGKVQISEPFGFDGSTITIEQKKGRHSRDVIIFNENTTFELPRSFFEPIETSQILPNGTIQNYLGHGFDYIVSEFENKGWELNIEYILDYKGVEYTTGKINGLTIKIKKNTLLIDVTSNTILKRFEANQDVSIDAFNNKDLEGNDIEPCQTSSIFLKAKPTKQKSILTNSLNEYLSQGNHPSSPTDFYTVFDTLELYGISNTLNPYENNPPPPNYDYKGFLVLSPNTLLTNIELKVTGKLEFQRIFNPPSAENISIRLGYKVEKLDLNDATFQQIGESNLLIGTNFTSQTYNETIIIDSIPSGYGLYVYFSHSALGNDIVRTTVVEKARLEITAISTGVSTVIKGIRLTDLLQHQARSVGVTMTDNVFTKPDYYNNFAMNGRMIGNLDDLPFNTKIKEVLPSVCDEAFADYEVIDEIVIDSISDYYKDVEIAQFDEISDISAEISSNESYAVKTFEVGFKKSSSERTGNENETNDDVHTNLQSNFPTIETDAVFKLDFNHIRSFNLIEEQRRRVNEVEAKSKALENDEQMFLIDCIQTPPNFKHNLQPLKLNYKINAAALTLELLSNGTFKWTNIGLQNTQNLNIVTDAFNADLFLATEITDFKITLQFVNNIPSSDLSGEAIMQISFLLTGVPYINRTNEGFAEIIGVDSPDSSNLLFTLKRILLKWKSVLANMSQFLPNKEIKVTEIKVNNKLETRLSTETENVVDFSQILTNDIEEYRFLDGKKYTKKVYCTFEKMQELKNNSRGYLRINTLDNKVILGYINNANYNIQKQELNLTLYGKKVNDVIELSTNIENIKNFNIFNEFVSIYDINTKLIYNINLYNKFSINGVIYDNVQDFSENLINLIN